MTTSYDKLFDLLTEEIKNDIKRGVTQWDIEESIGERVDSIIPVYTYDILSLALEDFSLATIKPESGEFDTAEKMIIANLYEKLYADAEEFISELEFDFE